MPEGLPAVTRVGGTFGRRTALRAGAFGAAGVAAAALIGCSSDDEEEQPAARGAPGGQGAAGGTTPVEGVTVAGRVVPYNFPEPAGKAPKSGGILVTAATWDVSTMDPTKSAAGGTITIPNTVYDRLLGYKRGPQVDPNKLELVPELASSWEATPDGLTYTFKLRTGVKWQNVAPLSGRAFKAADVKFAYDRYTAEGVHRAYFTNVRTIDATDDGTVKIALKSPQPDFLVALGSRYTTIHPKELVDAGEIDKKVIGTSAMILKSATAGQSVEFVRNPDHWRGVPYLEGKTFRIMTDSAAQLAAFRSDQLGLAPNVGANARDLEILLKTNPDVQVHAARPLNNLTSICVNLQLPKYQDERVRQAIMLAMDRQELIQTVKNGFGMSMPTFPWIFTFDTLPKAESGAFGKWWRTDVAESKRLLQAAGAENLTIPMIYYNYSDDRNKSQNEVLVNQLQKAGIKLEPQNVDYTTFNSQWVGGTYKEAADGWCSQGFDIDTYYYQHMRSDSPANRWHINDAELDKWADEQRVELNPQRRREILRKMWDKTLDKAYRIEKPETIGFIVYQPWLRGYRSLGVLGSNSYYYDWGAQLRDVWIDK